MNDLTQRRDQQGRSTGSPEIQWRAKVTYRADFSMTPAAERVDHEAVMEKARRGAQQAWFERWAADERDDPTQAD